MPCPASQAELPPTAAAAGSVSTQDTAIRPAIPHRISASLRPRPAPRIPPAQTCVVDSGNPMCEDVRMTVVAVVSAVNPWGDSMSVSPLPMVLMIRQPPAYVPSEIASPALRITHHGGSAPWPSTPRRSEPA